VNFPLSACAELLPGSEFNKEPAMQDDRKWTFPTQTDISVRFLTPLLCDVAELKD